MQAKRKPINKDGAFDGSSFAQVDFRPPDGLHWLVELCEAAYNTPVIPGLVLSAWYQPLLEPNSDSSKNVFLFQGVGDQNNIFMPVGGYIYQGPNQTPIASARKSLIILDANNLTVRYSGVAAFAGRGYQCRLLVWESPDLQELLCIAQSIN